MALIWYRPLLPVSCWLKCVIALMTRRVTLSLHRVEYTHRFCTCQLFGDTRVEESTAFGLQQWLTALGGSAAEGAS